MPTHPADLDANKVELLENIVAKSAELCDEEKELFFVLLAQHTDIFAPSKSDLVKLARFSMK